MKKQRLCLNIIHNEIPVREQLSLYRKTGFDGFFTHWKEDADWNALRAYADAEGLYFQSVHAPYFGVADMWRGGERADRALRELLRCVEDVARAGVSIMVCHVWIGFDTDETPTASGVETYRTLVERAKELGVQIAFENTEGDEFLATLLREFVDYPNVGFCLDTGHELCYNHNRDLLALYGDRLIATHLNDNLGIRSKSGVITPNDDLHLLPFDGVKDWEDVARRVRETGYTGDLTFEWKLSGSDCPQKEAYRQMPFEDYLAEGYRRACRVASLIQGNAE